MDPQRLAIECERLPIFVLPRAVLMPGASMPLHVFEPRYVELVRYCQARTSIFAIATQDDASVSEPPAVHPTVGVGMIVGTQPMPEGRCNLLLQYVGRARIEEELVTETPFRMVRSSLVPDDAQGAASAATSLKMMVLQLGTISKDASSEAGRLVDLDATEMADSLARRLFSKPDEQLEYLSTALVARRMGMVRDRLTGFLIRTDPVGSA